MHACWLHHESSSLGLATGASDGASGLGVLYALPVSAHGHAFS